MVPLVTTLKGEAAEYPGGEGAADEGSAQYNSRSDITGVKIKVLMAPAQQGSILGLLSSTTNSFN